MYTTYNFTVRVHTYYMVQSKQLCEMDEISSVCISLTVTSSVIPSPSTLSRLGCLSHTHAHTHAHTHVHTHMHAHTHIRTHTRTHTHIVTM